MATAKTTASLALTCPFCGVQGSTITLDLNDLARIECADCSQEFSPLEGLEKAQELVAQWERLVAWVGLAPVASE